MKNRKTAAFSILLILFSGVNGLFATHSHDCKGDGQESIDHCSMTMKKMDCCPENTESRSCQCPEMNQQKEMPGQTSPVIINNNNLQTGAEYIAYKTRVFNLFNDPVNEYKSFKILQPPKNSNKIYKTIQTFLI